MNEKGPGGRWGGSEIGWTINISRLFSLHQGHSREVTWHANRWRKKSETTPSSSERKKVYALSPKREEGKRGEEIQ